MTNLHAISWFEIPTADLDRATKFYETILGITLVYLNANPDVQLVLDRIVAAGGKILVPKTEISPEIGYMGVFMDSEGNRVALHAIPS